MPLKWTSLEVWPWDRKVVVVVITSAEGEAIIVLRLLDKEKKGMVQYGSETERALSLVPDSEWISPNCIVFDSPVSIYPPELT